ncbi:MAG: DUF5606 domain-containing protein [Salibacteraceae bacterium]
MDLSKILSISGKGGLFELVGQTKNGVIVISLIDGKRMPAYSNQQISSLEEISIYGEVEDVPLKEIFARIFKMENGKSTSVAPKSPGAELRDYFSDVVPEHDQERVYNSDIKKVLSWYNLLLSKDMINLEEEKSEEPTEESASNDADTTEEGA